MLQHCSVSCEMLDLFEGYAAENRSVILVLGHFGNWEWAGNSFSLLCKHQLFVIYHPLQNKYFNELMIKMRTKFGTKLIAMNNVFREMLSKKETLNATAFIADQTPTPANAFWTTFLNQDTAVFKGTEAIAKKMNLPVVYVSVNRVKRGYYEMRAEVLTDKPMKEVDGAITIAHTKKLEYDISQIPETWIWSHRRWKHQKPNLI